MLLDLNIEKKRCSSTQVNTSSMLPDLNIEKYSSYNWQQVSSLRGCPYAPVIPSQRLTIKIVI